VNHFRPLSKTSTPASASCRVVYFALRQRYTDADADADADTGTGTGTTIYIHTYMKHAYMRTYLHT